MTKYRSDMQYLIEIMERITLEEITQEYSGQVSQEEEKRAKIDCKNRMPYLITPRRAGRRPKKINR